MRIPESFELIEKKNIKDIASMGYLLRHKKTGARAFILENDDENKVFSIGFRTTPPDSTGVAHIIEHTVLCGSEKYPAKDPFVELVKGSLNTFLNAMTYPDKTVYPVASCNDKDFQNLCSVYMDAVFHPNIYHNKMLFEQEGWHYELSDREDELTINGVVYNEMKGAYSSADDLLGELITRALYPDTEYSHDSGGFPKDIPSLTYENFLDFHRRYYHPSNSFLYLYGNADMAEKLEWIDREYFGKYERLEIDSMPSYQDAFLQPGFKRDIYGITEDESEENNTYLAWARVMGDTSDPESCAAFGLLCSVLLDAQGAPIKQALADAGIGEEVYGYYADSMRQPYFAIVAKGANEAQREEFERIIEDTLKKLVENGLNKKSILAALVSQEFSTKEADFGNYPKGLIYGLDTYGYWLYDDNAVFDNLCFENIYSSLRSKIDIDYFEHIIKIMLLDNTHGATVVLAPKKGYNEEQEQMLSAELAAKKAGFSDEELDQIAEHTAALKEFQNTPSTAEELEKIPMLSVADVKKESPKFSNIKTELAGADIIRHDFFTSGIDYFTFCYDLGAFSLEDIPYLSLLSSYYGMVDTEKYTYRELADEIRIKLGGMGMDIVTYNRNDEILINFEVSLKCLSGQTSEALELMTEIMKKSSFTDKKHLKELLAESKSKLAGMLMERGNTFALMRCGSYYSENMYIQDLKGGIAFYTFIEELNKSFDDKADELIEKLTELEAKIAQKAKLTVSYTGTEELFEKAKASLGAYIGEFSVAKTDNVEKNIKLEAKNEGFKTSSQVNYVSRCGNYTIADPGLEYTGHMSVLKVWMGYEYLWVNVRVKGGAYGCHSLFNRKGMVGMTSYRDPNVAATSEVFMNAADNIRNIDFSDRDMTKYILGAINEKDTPLSPSRNGSTSMCAYFMNVTNEEIQKEREQILSTTIEDLRACGEKIDKAMQQGYICAVGNASQIEADKEVFKTVLPLFH